MKEALKEQVTTVMARIPQGRVTTYGTIARMTEGATARSVGYVLRTLPAGHDLPWFRIVRSGGILADHGGADDQRRRLQDEGIVFDERGRIPARFFWP
ncbi:MGMT family protein [Larsenimonas salina]|uniref:MGMT family protein n=1 Tax=Larsenimonas salina TaxID=1295565 RepID=UPI0020739E26|nr:MGMT family protein [Larsenimonas salina]